MRVSLKGIHTVQKRLADGSAATYRYAWRGGPRLLSEPGSPAFVAEYAGKVAERRTPAAGTFFSLIADFKASSEFTGLADSTRRAYLLYIKAIEAEFGDMPKAAVVAPEARGIFKEWRDTMAAKPRTADFAWTVLARILSVAKDRGKIAVNVCERGGRLYRADRSDALWTPAMVEVVKAEFPTALRWAFILALYTGQRQSDLLRMPWSAVEGGRVRLRQRKGRRRVSIPIPSVLAEELATIPKRSTIILTSSDERPWTASGFRASWARACAAADIHGVTFHDIRGSAVTNLGAAGCTTIEIAAVTGHSLKDVEAILDAHYLSRTDAMADNAIGKLERNEQRTKL